MTNPYKFSVVRNASDTKVELMTAYDIRQLTNRIDRHTIGQIRIGSGELKRNLPAVCWAAEFRDGKRHAGEGGQNIKDNGLRFIDIDHITNATTPAGRRKDVLEYYERHIAPIVVDRFVLHVQISPSGDGLHVVWVDDSLTLEQAQAEFARAAGLPNYDDKCKDQGRMLFLSPIEDTLLDLTDMCFE